MTLSKREKTLLFILALLVILLVSWMYVITPMLQANQEAKLAYVAAQEEQAQMEAIMPTLIGADERLAAEQERAAQENYFFKNIIDTKIDWMIQDVARLSGGVELQRVVINPAQIGPVATPLEAEDTDSTGKVENVDDLITAVTDIAKGKDEQKEEKPVTSNLTQNLYNCSFELWGTLDGCMKALDQFSKMENSVLVDFFEIKFDKNKQKFVAKVNLIFYFVER